MILDSIVGALVAASRQFLKTLRARYLVLRLCAAVGLAVSATSPLALAQSNDAQPTQSPQQWLEQMDSAFVKHNYDGMFSYFNGADMASLRVVHMVIDGVQHERLVHLNGAPREIVREGDDVSCIVMPGDDLLEMEKSMPAGPFARAFVRQFDSISANYSLSFFGNDRVAERDARRLAITPHDNHRFGYRLWLDAQTQLLLRSELIDKDGQRLEIFQFTHIKIGSEVTAKALQPQTKEGGRISHLALASSKPVAVTEVSAKWHATWVPNGFSMAAAEVRRKPESLIAVNTLVYTDGVAAFSIFVEEMPEAGASNMMSRNGATVAVAQRQMHNQQEQLITVVGEIPTATARRIAGSVVPAAVAALSH